MKHSTFKYAFTKSLPVIAGYIVLGFGFGVLLFNKGYSFIWAFLMSTFIYAGSLQYIGIDLLANSASFMSIALISFLVNARHIFYGISMLKPYENTGLIKPFIIATLTDETYSLVCTNDFPKEIDKKKYFLYISLLNQSYWILGSLIGNLIGSVFSFNTTGIDFSMTALFIVVFIEQWKKNKEHLPAILGLCISIFCLIIFGKNNFLIPTMLLIPSSLIFLKSFIEKRNSIFEIEKEVVKND